MGLFHACQSGVATMSPLTRLAYSIHTPSQVQYMNASMRNTISLCLRNRAKFSELFNMKLSLALGACHAIAAIAQTCANLPANLPLSNYTPLNNPFVFVSGQPVRTAADWQCRQGEISSLFQKYELGSKPAAPSRHATLTHAHQREFLDLVVVTNITQASLLLSPPTP